MCEYENDNKASIAENITIGDLEVNGVIIHTGSFAVTYARRHEDNVNYHGTQVQGYSLRYHSFIQ